MHDSIIAQRWSHPLIVCDELFMFVGICLVLVENVLRWTIGMLGGECWLLLMVLLLLLLLLIIKQALGQPHYRLSITDSDILERVVVVVAAVSSQYVIHIKRACILVPTRLEQRSPRFMSIINLIPFLGYISTIPIILLLISFELHELSILAALFSST